MVTYSSGIAPPNFIGPLTDTIVQFSGHVPIGMIGLGDDANFVIGIYVRAG